MILFQNLILFTNHYGSLKAMLEMIFFLKYVDLYLTSEWGRFYVGHPVFHEAVKGRCMAASEDFGGIILHKFTTDKLFVKHHCCMHLDPIISEVSNIRFCGP
jgi:hypothetical protein